MKPISVAIVFLLSTTISGYCADNLKQNFEGPIFPPAGWTIELSGTGPYWEALWNRQDYNGSFWAFGLANAGAGTGLSTSDSKLFTPYSTLNQGDFLIIRFTMFGEIVPPVAYQNYVAIYLYDGSNEVWHHTALVYQIPSLPTAIKLVTGAIPANSTNYRICWWLHAVGGNNLPSTTSTVHLDNVIITRIASSRNNISSTTLGQLKAVYAR